MPYKPKRPCRYPGCPNLSDRTYCEKHRGWDARETAAERGYDSRWQRERELYLRKNPLCVKCKAKGKITPARVVDHIIPHRGDPLLRWDRNNWQALCKDCHDTKTGNEDSNPVYSYNR